MCECMNSHNAGSVNVPLPVSWPPPSLVRIASPFVHTYFLTPFDIADIAPNIATTAYRRHRHHCLLSLYCDIAFIPSPSRTCFAILYNCYTSPTRYCHIKSKPPASVESNQSNQSGQSLPLFPNPLFSPISLYDSSSSQDHRLQTVFPFFRCFSPDSTSCSGTIVCIFTWSCRIINSLKLLVCSFLWCFLSSSAVHHSSCHKQPSKVILCLSSSFNDPLT